MVMEEEKQAIVSSSSSQRKRRNVKLVNIASPSLPDYVVEEIFLQLPVKALMRLKSLSKQWRSTIESHYFSQRHLKIAERSHLDHPQIMIITEKWDPDRKISFWTMSLESVRSLPSDIFTFSHGFHHLRSIYASESCDGLFCIYSPKTQDIYVVNPATRWFRQLPPARSQVIVHKLKPTLDTWIEPVSHLAFVKGATDYKLVWLYNSDTYNSDVLSPNEGVTKCEVFDFKSNAWRYLTCTPSYRIFHVQTPTSANESLYWFTEPYDAEIKVIAFDIQAETFRLLPKPSLITSLDHDHIDMCSLDNDLCMYETDGDDTMIQEIWKLKSSEDTWEKIYTINLLSSSYSNDFHFLDGFNLTNGFNWTQKDLVELFTPVAIYKKKKNLLSHRYTRNLANLQTERLYSFLKQFLSIRSAPYFPSLISHI